MDDAGQDDEIAHNQSRDDGGRHDQIYQREISIVVVLIRFNPNLRCVSFNDVP